MNRKKESATDIRIRLIGYSLNHWPESYKWGGTLRADMRYLLMLARRLRKLQAKVILKGGE